MPDDVLRLRATVVSEEALANIRAIGREIGMVPTKAGKGVQEVNSSFATLGKTIKGVGSELKSAVPSLGAFGLGAAGVGIAARTLISTLGDISSKIVQMKYASKELGLSEQALRAFTSEAQKAGIAPEAMMAGLQGMKDTVYDFKNRMGELRGELYAMGAGDFVNRVKASTDMLGALKEAFDMKEAMKQVDPSGEMGRRFFDKIKLGSGAARLSWEQFYETYKTKRVFTDDEIKTAEKFNGMLVELGESWDMLKAKFGVRLIPAISRDLEDLNKIVGLLGKVDDWISSKTSKGDGGGAAPGGAPGGEALPWLLGRTLPGRIYNFSRKLLQAAPGTGSDGAAPAAPGGALSPLIAPGPQSGLSSGFKPVSFGGFNQGGESSGASRIVQIGVFDALVQFKSYAETGSTGGGSGFTNASYSPGGGLGTGGTGGGDNSPIGRAFRAATGGTGAGTSGAPAGTTTGGTPGGTSVGGDGTGGSGVPSAFASDVAAMTAAGAQPKDIQQYLKSKGVDVGVATCGQFMAAAVKDHGGTPPQNPAIASSWNTFGGKEGAGYSSDPNAINVAVRQGVATGSTGSHVTAAIPITDAQGNVTGFRGVGVNQGEGRSVISSHNLKIGTGPGQYQIRHQIPAGAQPAGAQAPTGNSGGLAGARAQFAAEMKNDPDLARLLSASTNAEVGGQSKAAQQDYIESVMNRAAARGKSLRETLTDSRYYPGTTTSKLGANADPKQHADIVAAVIAGSNTSDLATGNESGGVHSGGAQVTKDYGPRAERFVREKNKKDQAFVARMQQANRIDTANRPPSVNGNVNVTVNSNGTKANAKVNEAGDLYQGTTVKQHKQMQRTEDAGETLSI
jgi:hypothetical protein